MFGGKWEIKTNQIFKFRKHLKMALLQHIYDQIIVLWYYFWILKRLWMYISLFRYLLALIHILYCVVSVIQGGRVCIMASKINQFRVQKGKNLDYISALKWITEMFALFVIKYIFNPILVGLILYGGDSIGKQRTRVASSVSIITTSYLYLSSISRFPSIGRYTNMLTKVGQLSNFLIQMASIIYFNRSLSSQAHKITLILCR